MATIKEFCNAMIEVFRNHGVYIGTGNGEYTETLTIGKIRQMETDYGYSKSDTDVNIGRVLSYIGKCYKAGYNMEKSRSGDCSGIVVGVMRDLELIKPTDDFNCRTFMKACKKIVTLKELQPGDLVFNKTSEPSHMGVYVGAVDGTDGMVVESKGRDAGVVLRRVTEGNWKCGGRLDWFDDEIPPLTRNLYYIKGDRMTGEDVLACKQQLCTKGFLKSKYVDNIFGKHSDAATRKFQEANDLVVDGIVGQKTWAKLWEK